MRRARTERPAMLPHTASFAGSGLLKVLVGMLVANHRTLKEYFALLFVDPHRVLILRLNPK